MRQSLWLVGVFFLFLAYTAGEAGAQFRGVGYPGEDVISVGLLYGQLDPQTAFRDGSRFGSGSLVGIHGSFWAHRYAGLQLHVSGARSSPDRSEGGEPTIVGGREPRHTHLILDGVLRYPMPLADRFSWFPYVSAGTGIKSYNFGRQPRPAVTPAWNYAVGAEVRTGPDQRIGLRLEFRDIRAQLDRFGEDLRHSDRVLASGLTFTF